MIDHELRQKLMLYISEVWKRRWIAFGVCITLCLAGWGWVISQPDVFSSSGRIYVDTQTVLRPLLSGLAVESDVGAELRAMQETLLSRPNLERVARVTDLDINAQSSDEMEELLSGLKKRIAVNRSAAEIYTLTVSDVQPLRAKDTVQALMDIFVENNIGRHRQDMESAQKFLNEQLNYYETQLEDAEQRLAKFKQENMAFLPGSDDYYERLSTAQSDLSGSEARLRESIRERDVLRQELQALPPMVATTATLGPPSDAGLELIQVQAELRNLQEELGKMLLSYTDRHPDVLALKRRIADLRREQKDLQAQNAAYEAGQAPPGSGGPLQGAQVPNPAYTGIQIRLIEKETEIAGLEQVVERLQQKVATLQGSAMAVPEVEAQLKKLDRDYGIIKAKYDALLQRRESANLAEKRSETGDAVQFRVVEAPQVPTTPTSPNRPLLLTAVAILGLGGGIGVALFLTLMNDTFVDARGLKDHFDLPVFGAVTLVEGMGSRAQRVVGMSIFMIACAMFASTYSGLMVVENEIGLREAVQILTESGSATAAIDAVSQAFIR